MVKLLVILSIFIGFNAYAGHQDLINEFGNVFQGDLIEKGEVTPQPEHNHHRPFYDWGRGQNGWGYCYQFDKYGYVMNNGRPVNNRMCERYNPSYYAWAYATNGYTYCFQFTPYNVVMNEGRSVHPRFCRY